MTLEFVMPAALPPTMNVLLYGPPGSGKTTGALSAPGPILLLNAEGQGAARYARGIYGDDKIREVVVTGKAALDEVYLYLKGQKGGEKSVVVDTIGETYRILLDELAATAKDGRPTLQMWGDVNTVIERFVRAIRDLSMNVILVCHEEVQRDETTGEALRMPLTGGRKLPAILTAQVDVVGYTGVIPERDGKPTRYVAQLVSSGGRYGKDRSGRLGASRDVNIAEWVSVATATKTERKAA